MELFLYTGKYLVQFDDILCNCGCTKSADHKNGGGFFDLRAATFSTIGFVFPKKKTYFLQINSTQLKNRFPKI